MKCCEPEQNYMLDCHVAPTGFYSHWSNIVTKMSMRMPTFCCSTAGSFVSGTSEVSNRQQVFQGHISVVFFAHSLAVGSQSIG